MWVVRGWAATGVALLKIDVDANGGAATKYSISSLPTLKLFRGGAEVAVAMGDRVTFMPPSPRIIHS